MGGVLGRQQLGLLSARPGVSNGRCVACFFDHQQAPFTYANASFPKQIAYASAPQMGYVCGFVGGLLPEAWLPICFGEL